MKRYLTALFLLLAPFLSFSQKLSDANSLKKAIDFANEKQKPLLLIINVSIPARANVTVPNLGLKEADIFKKLKANFVVYETDRSSSEISKIVSTYKIRMFPAFLFLHSNMDLFYKESSYSTDKNRYHVMLDKAIAQSKEKTMSEMQAEYQADQKNNVLLEKLIATRIKNGITDNAELIEQYAQNLNKEDLNDYSKVLFILKAGPYAYGNAYKLAWSNRKLADSIYKTEPLEIRRDFNNYIINNTMANAIRTKNVNQALAAASFARNSWGKDYNSGQKTYSVRMLSYYQAVGDTSNYFRNAVRYYDTYYMNISAAAIKLAEVKQRDAALERMKSSLPISANIPIISKEKRDSSMANSKTVIRRDTIRTITAVSTSSSYANTLNSAAWGFYQTGTTNIDYLTKAMLWSRRSLELESNSAYYDTLAHILYRMGYLAEAVKTEETAINQAKIDGGSYTSMQTTLKKMRDKEL